MKVTMVSCCSDTKAAALLDNKVVIIIVMVSVVIVIVSLQSIVTFLLLFSHIEYFLACVGTGGHGTENQTGATTDTLTGTRRMMRISFVMSGVFVGTLV